MTGGKKPANAKAWAMLRKLQALAERGINGEKAAAQHKMDRLRARFDFEASESPEEPDLFRGSFKRSRKAVRIYTVHGLGFDIANAVKWAIENATGIRCHFRESELLAEATPSTARRLAQIATQIGQSFCALVSRYGEASGVGVTDRSAFLMGLYDGMMNENRVAGQSLPRSTERRKKGRGKASATAIPGVKVHPYTLAVSLGRQIRFSVPLQQITAELEDAVQPLGVPDRTEPNRTGAAANEPE